MTCLYESRGFFITAKPPEQSRAPRAVILGAPLDSTVTFRPGSRFAPHAIREASYVLETYSPRLDRDLESLDLVDQGDVILPYGNVAKSLETIKEAAYAHLAKERFLLTLGGEHLITLPLLQAAHRVYPDLVLLHFDAHTDLRTSYEGEVLSHATVIYQATELLGKGRVYSLGIRSGTKEEFALYGERLYGAPYEVWAKLPEVIEAIADRPVYITFDIDVLDPAYAPGTGTPEPDGITANEWFRSLYYLAASGIKVVAADLVEVLPAYDPSGRTSVLAAKIVREMLLAFAS